MSKTFKGNISQKENATGMLGEAKLLTILVNPDSHRISPALPLFVSSNRSSFHIAIGPLSAISLQPNATISYVKPAKKAVKLSGVLAPLTCCMYILRMYLGERTKLKMATAGGSTQHK